MTKKQPLVVFDLFAGTGSATQAFEDAGHLVYRFELDSNFTATEHVDVATLDPGKLVARYGHPDFVWASPPCTAFSVANIGANWANGGSSPTPKTQTARDSMQLVATTVALVQALNPTYGYLIENPRGMLRKLPVVAGLPRRTVTYCQYGDSRQKPTDLWGDVPGWTPRAACKPGAPCHDAAPRGSKTGTQGLKGAAVRSMLPYQLGADLCAAIHKAAGI